MELNHYEVERGFKDKGNIASHTALFYFTNLSIFQVLDPKVT